MRNISFLDNTQLETLFSSQNILFLQTSLHCFLYHVPHVNNWYNFTQNALIVAFQLNTLWCEHHSATRALSKLITFCLDPQCCSDQRKESGIEHHSPITVQWHIHGDKALWSKEEKDNNHTSSRTQFCSSLTHDVLQTCHPFHFSICNLWVWLHNFKSTSHIHHLSQLW